LTVIRDYSIASMSKQPFAQQVPLDIARAR
jgi:hypothetical protein